MNPRTPFLMTTEDVAREQRRNAKRWAAHKQRDRAALIVLSIACAIGVALILWQVTQTQPTYWIVYLGMALVVPLMARAGRKVLNYM